jgi:hypothetical protein
MLIAPLMTQVDGAVVTVDLAGERPPAEVGSLVETVRQELGSDVSDIAHVADIEVVVRFSERRRLPIPSEITPLPTMPPT